VKNSDRFYWMTLSCHLLTLTRKIDISHPPPILLLAPQPNANKGRFILQVSISHMSHTHSEGLLPTRDRPVAKPLPHPHNTPKTIRTRNPSQQTATETSVPWIGMFKYRDIILSAHFRLWHPVDSFIMQTVTADWPLSLVFEQWREMTKQLFR
jgi:hypothetical protein